MYYVIYSFFYIFSLLPFRILYFISDLLYILLYYVIGYRLNIVKNNLLIAFPEKTEEERAAITRQFYKNLIDTFIETIKMISLSKDKFLQRCDGNFEVLDTIIKSGKNVQLQSAHQFNWEYGNWILPFKLELPVASVYMPIKNKALNKIFLKLRSRFGTVMIDATHYSKDIKKVARHQHALALVADQNPGWPGRAYWLKFFKRPAPFLIGPEKGAIRSNNAVVFTRFVKIKRGHYYFENYILTENAAECKPGEITRKFRDFIEDAIAREPAGFLWSHRRWKHEYKKEYQNLWIDVEKPAEQITQR
ncbi:MAG: lipid A biosynthesis acyltransferase [Ginsengibacter sp.]